MLYNKKIPKNESIKKTFKAKIKNMMNTFYVPHKIPIYGRRTKLIGYILKSVKQKKQNMKLGLTPLSLNKIKLLVSA